VDGIDRFLGDERWGSLCAEDPAGDLWAMPVLLAGGSSVEVRMVSPDRDATDAIAAGQSSVCVVADIFETYEGIEGVILRGRVHENGHAGGGLALEVVSKLGFTFAGSLPPELRQAADGGAGGSADGVAAGGPGRGTEG
jgi:hypothetical protein